RAARARRRSWLEGVRRTRPARSRTAFRDIALARRGSTGRRRRLEGVVTGCGVGSRAVVGGVVVAHATLRAARARRRGWLEAVRRTRATGSRAAFRYVALTGRAAADRGAVLEDIHARVAGPRAVIGRVVVAHATLRRARARR